MGIQENVCDFVSQSLFPECLRRAGHLFQQWTDGHRPWLDGADVAVNGGDGKDEARRMCPVRRVLRMELLGLWGGRGVILNEVDRERFTEGLTFRQRPEGGEGVRHAGLRGRLPQAGGQRAQSPWRGDRVAGAA